MKTPFWIKTAIEPTYINNSNYVNLKISCRDKYIRLYLNSKTYAEKIANELSGQHDNGLIFLRNLKEKISKYALHNPDGLVLDFCLEVLKDN